MKKVKFKYEGGNVILTGHLIETSGNTCKIKTECRIYTVPKEALIN